MSGGQQQMLAIARALMAQPRLVIFDEISLGLAPVVMDKLYEALTLLKQAGMTLIVIEQDVDRALALVDYAYVLEHGVVALAGAPKTVAADPRLRHIYVGAAD
jgi:ABC-type branched-subunit amino acid transport system ATPase component